MNTLNFQPEHIGLYFGQAEIDAAQATRDNKKFAAAWERLKNPPVPEAVPAAMWHALRYRLLNNAAEGEKGISGLLSLSSIDSETFYEATRQLIARAHIFEMLRLHPAFTAQQQWLNDFAAHADELLKVESDDYIDVAWRMTLKIVAAIVLDNEDIFTEGIAEFRKSIDADIHPDGYIHRAVKAKNTNTFLRQLRASAALCLAAEAAMQVGVNLWDTGSRGVDANTPIAYLNFFYFYPERWQWSEGLTRDDTERMIRREGAFIEIAAHRGIIRDIDILLDDQRPLIDVYGGGIPTLTHPDIQKRKGFSLFRR
ncbi:MAG: alginate lyase family protein [Aggregatilineales bacterium]